MSDDGEEFDFIKAFADIDLLAVEAMGNVIGRAVGALYNGMIAAGLDEESAHYILRSAITELFRNLRPGT